MDKIIDEIFNTTINHEKKNLIELALKGTEEMGEVAEAVLSCMKTYGNEYKHKTLNDVREECCDVIMIILALIAKTGITNGEMKNEILRKIEKWKSKIMVDEKGDTYEQTK